MKDTPLHKIMALKREILQKSCSYNEALLLLENLTEEFDAKKDLEILVYLKNIQHLVKETLHLIDKRKQINNELLDFLILPEKEFLQQQNKIVKVLFSLNALPKSL